jgi:hypothetical protein
VVLDRHDLDLLQVEAELQQAPFDAFLVAVVSGGCRRGSRRARGPGVPVALGVVPARLLERLIGAKGMATASTSAGLMPAKSRQNFAAS